MQPSPSSAPPAPAGSSSLDRAACLRLEQALFREWLEADGRGGYASSTVHLCPSRRYHGLLVAPPAPGAERHVFLSRFEEEIVGPTRAFPLSTCRYAGLYSPEGYQAIESFQLDPFPTWHYRIGDLELTRELVALRGRHVVLVRWARRGGPPDVRLRLRPLLACRRSHDLTHENVDLDPRAIRLTGGDGAGIRCQPYRALPPLSIHAAPGPLEYRADPLWFRGVELAMEARRGFDSHEDHFSPGVLEIPLKDGDEVVVAATIEGSIPDPRPLWRAESERRRAEATGVRDLASRLALAAEHFLYRDAHGRPGVIAGYPWFGEWGRDTFIALPGLTLARGRSEASLAVLEGALPFLRGGLLPNVYGADPATSSYRSADAALWFARAVLLHERATGASELVRKRFLPGLVSIAEAYLAGTELGLAVDASGLLRAGGPSLNATWMDAMIDGVPVTPRAGSPVELQALWYQLLAYLTELCQGAGDRSAAARWRVEAERAGSALVERFWLSDEGTLADVVGPDGALDRSVRPNAVIAASLELSPLSSAQRADVVQVALNELVTPRGLRTLSPHDPRYVGLYQGGPVERDRAYHQGTVWPFLLGFAVEAALRAFPAAGARVRRLEKAVEGFVDTLDEHGLGQVSEVYDGDPPHRPGGTPAQAWSVAELLRALVLLRERGA